MKKCEYSDCCLFIFILLTFLASKAQGSEPYKTTSANTTVSIAPPRMEGLSESLSLTFSNQLSPASLLLTKGALALTLADAVAIGLRNNRTIRSAYLQRTSQKFDLRVAEDKFTPQLSVSGTYLVTQQSSLLPVLPSTTVRTTEIKPAATLNLPTGAQVALSWSGMDNSTDDPAAVSSSALALSLTQPLLRNAGSDMSMASVRTARINERIHLFNLKRAVSQSIVDVIFSYREFLRAQDQLKIAQDALSRSRRLLEINSALIEAGRMAKIDILQTEADVASQELAVEEAENQLDAARLALLTLLAMDVGTSISATDALFSKPVLVDIDKALSVAFDNQPDYFATLLSVERAQINLDVAKNQRLWDVSLVAGINSYKNKSPTQNDLLQSQKKDTYAGLQLMIPLTDLTYEQAEVKASTDLKNAAIQLEEARQFIEQRVHDAVRNVHTRWRQLEIAQRARSLSFKKLEAEREKLQVGRSSNFQVLTFESDLRNAENMQLNAMIAYMNALTILDQQQGTILDTWHITLTD